MAIAIDNSGGTVASGGGSVTQAFTVGVGSDRKLFVAVEIQSGGDVLTGVTYAGVSMTQAVKRVGVFSASFFEYIYYLDAPTSGSNNIVISYSGGVRTAAFAYASYTGCTTGTDSTAQSSAASGTTFAQAFTTVANNAWTINWIRTSTGGSNPAAGAGSFERVTGATIGDNGLGLFDSNANVTPAGSYTMNYTSGNTDWTSVGVSFAPVVTTVPSGFFMATAQ